MIQNNTEIWKDIPGYEGLYKISNTGKILSISKTRTGYSYMAKKKINRSYKDRILRPQKIGNYFGVALTKNGDQKTLLVHRLVALAFLPNHENMPNINHIDFNTHNNSIDNLEWCTQLENIHHSMNAGRNRKASGENCGASKFTNIQVKKIRTIPKNHNHIEIAKIFNVHPETISKIRRGITYKNIL